MRRKAREIALQLLFQKEFAPPISTQLWQTTIQSDDNQVADSKKQEKIASETLKYAESLVEGVKNKQTEIDSLIQRFSQHWKIERMTTIDRNIIRLGIFELKFAVPPLPAGIAINEAVELAKIFSTTDSPSFINGILDQVNKA
jgi:N utilization substance protein B